MINVSTLSVSELKHHLHERLGGMEKRRIEKCIEKWELVALLCETLPCPPSPSAPCTTGRGCSGAGAGAGVGTGAGAGAGAGAAASGSGHETSAVQRKRNGIPNAQGNAGTARTPRQGETKPPSPRVALDDKVDSSHCTALHRMAEARPPCPPTHRERETSGGCSVVVLKTEIWRCENGTQVFFFVRRRLVYAMRFVWWCVFSRR